MNTEVTNIGREQALEVASNTGVHAVPIELSPALVMAASLLYVIVCNGRVKESELIQWKYAIGANIDLARCAIDYVKDTPPEVFLRNAPAVLNKKDKLCTLTNICDSMLSDGYCDAAKFRFLVNCTDSFGISDVQFDPVYEAMVIKNDKSVLGEFEIETISAVKLTPHLAWAAAMSYLLSSNGALSTSELARLQAMMAEFIGLAQAGAKYSSQLESDIFFSQASNLLNLEQKKFILINAYDFLLSDGISDLAKKSVFSRMFKAFGYTNSEFEAFEVAITAKHIKSIDMRLFTDPRSRSDTFAVASVKSEEIPFGNIDIFHSLAKRFIAESDRRETKTVKAPPNFISAKKLHGIAISAAPSLGWQEPMMHKESTDRPSPEPQGGSGGVLPPIFADSAQEAIRNPEPALAPVRVPKKRQRNNSVEPSDHAQFHAKISALRATMLGERTQIEGSAQPKLSKLPTLRPQPLLTVALVAFVIACVAGSSLLFWMLSVD